MLRCVGFFSDLDCPFWGACERPHCQYGHGRSQQGSTRESGKRVVGQVHDSCTLEHLKGRTPKPFTEPTEVPISSQLDAGIAELEQINKAIEVVKTEVEQEQKKLLQYKHLVQHETSEVSDVSKVTKVDIHPFDQTQALNSEQNPEPIESNDCIPSTNSKQPSSKGTGVSSETSGKYVIDHSCPMTDLEYDPLLNYSAGLMNKIPTKDVSEQKQGIKKIKEHLLKDKREPPSKRARCSQTIKLEIKLQESDDDVLVIDAPPLTNHPRKNRASRKLPNKEKSDGKESYLHSTCEGLFEKPATEKPLENSGTDGAPKEASCFSTHSPSNDSKEVRKSLLIEKESEKMQTSLHGSSEYLKTNASRMENRCGNEKKNESSPEKELKASFRSHSHIGESQQKPKTEEPKSRIRGMYKNVSWRADEAQVKSKSQSDGMKLTKTVESQENDETKVLPKLQLIEKQDSKDLAFSLREGTPAESKNLNTRQMERNASGCGSHKETGTLNGPTVCMDVKANDVIILNSSEEEMENLGQDVDLSESDSDSDPMDECRRIFYEFAAAEAQDKERNDKQVVVEDNPEIEMSEFKKMPSLIPGQKKRIAHAAKYNVKSSSRQILVPYREAAPCQACPSRILQVQQQAIQLTAAIKSGQAFVATTGQKKATTTAELSNTQLYNVGKTVHLNLTRRNSIACSSSSNSYIMVQGGNVTGMTSKTGTAALRVAPVLAVKESGHRKCALSAEGGAKVPHDVRQRYVNLFVEEYLKFSSTVQEAFNKAWSEEKAVYNRSGSKIMYLNIAINTLKKMRDRGSQSSTVISPSHGIGETAGNFSRKLQEEKIGFSGSELYRLLTDYVLTEEQLRENGYPHPHPEKPGTAVLLNGVPKRNVGDSLKRVCCRCGETYYSVTSKGKHVRKEECSYHWGRVLRQKVPGGVDTRYSCCEGLVGTPGCQVAKLHVHDGRKENLDGFMKTFKKQPPIDRNCGVFGVDCEMCYTTQGLELTRVTVVDSSLQVVYDVFVKPDSEVIDYNTRYSGVTEKDLLNTTSSIRDVQAVLLNMFNADTILIGHSLESDLIALKLLHSTIIDTSLVFPHRLGLPYKRTLRNLMADYLRRIIQDHVGGHDSRQDAAACMELMLWKIKEDNKGKRW
ncbi:RNA exonuclease 1 homolog [Latimeria chalumnae]|nr:PREDICTED: RNA exonuclease 1 homolog [Latimeria chalumnae]|eukprot:XP_014348705.1 PREDICTED: RNA exonuclease 1 homolog [Latimeria chalumnae]